MDSPEKKKQFTTIRQSQVLEYPINLIADMVAGQEYNTAMLTKAINGYLSGQITRDQLKAINDKYGVAREAYQMMKDMDIL
ncbi:MULTISPECIES: hypothetical protein [Aerococcus]|uniref:Antitoxin n=2 Tax=Aerococcus TaxID=1375 RepID=A0ABT4C633_9LACT|nr:MULTISPECIES: hypothetical protein [Aerococcus]AMB95566.1 hypothetical protein AWM73_03050 [Aerococcus urinae]KAA9237215.1 hypothetical protein F6I34_09685 [Aerococcus urinae]MCY3032570.1 hypothetical protein [Aerococcus urinae]MCY3037871.1 hypothetical protein [Aerococcus urinae]MCY3044616.1 hypothetical protein [Aerococcus urinae]